jgi:hypothetical protein
MTVHHEPPEDGTSTAHAGRGCALRFTREGEAKATARSADEGQTGARPPLLARAGGTRHDRSSPHVRAALRAATVTGPIVGGMVDLREENFDFISTGWLRYLPEPAFNAYGRLWVMTLDDDDGAAGDLDDLGAEALDVAVFGGLDTPYEPPPTGTLSCSRARSRCGPGDGRSSATRPSSAACQCGRRATQSSSCARSASSTA